MKIQDECIPCLIKRIVFEAEQSTDDPKIRTKTIKNACRALADYYDPNNCSASVATQVHRVAYDTLGDDDPYSDLKHMSNKIALSLVPRVERLIKVADDPLRMSMLCAIVGNMLDFGIEGGSEHPFREGRPLQEALDLGAPLVEGREGEFTEQRTLFTHDGSLASARRGPGWMQGSRRRKTH